MTNLRRCTCQNVPKFVQLIQTDATQANRIGMQSDSILTEEAECLHPASSLLQNTCTTFANSKKFSEVCMSHKQPAINGLQPVAEARSLSVTQRGQRTDQVKMSERGRNAASFPLTCAMLCAPSQCMTRTLEMLMDRTELSDSENGKLPDMGGAAPTATGSG